MNKRRNQLGGEGGGGERGGEGQKENGEVRSHSISSTREVHPQNAYVTG